MSDRPPLDGWHFTSFVVTDRGPNSAARWRSSVPLARPLSPPDPNPLSVLRLIRQVLRELRVILCQTLQAHVASNSDIRNFCPIVVTFSTGLFTQSTTSHYLDASFPQVEDPARRDSEQYVSVRSCVAASFCARRCSSSGPRPWTSCLNLRPMPVARDDVSIRSATRHPPMTSLGVRRRNVPISFFTVVSCRWRSSSRS